MRLLTEQERLRIKELYNSGLNCVEIKLEMALKHHQQVLNVLNKLGNYIPYRNGRGVKRKYALNESYFDIIDTEEKAYFLGFICADGYLDTEWKRLKLLVQTRDIDILEKFRKSIGSNTRILSYVRQSRFPYGKREFNHSHVEFCSSKLIKSLTDKGLCGRKSDNLRSSIANYVPEGLMRHFLRGYFDGDGNILFGKKYSSGVKYLVQIAGNLEFLQNTFGKYFPTVNKYYKYKNSKQTWAYKVSSKNKVLSFLKYIYDDCTVYLDRKYEIYKHAHIKPIELLGTLPDKLRAISSQASNEEGSETIEKQEIS